MLIVRHDLIEDAPAETIVEQVSKLIKEGAGKGKFVVLFNLIPIGAPCSHIFTAVDTVKQCGRCPLCRDINRMAFRPRDFKPFSEWLATAGFSVS